MAIAFVNDGASTPGTPVNPDILNSTDLSTYDNTSWTPPASGLLLAAIHNREALGDNNVSSVVHDPTGANKAWTFITSVLFGAGDINSLSLFAIDASTLGAGIDRVDYGGVTQLGCAMSIFHATGVDLSGGIAGAFVQTPTNTDGGTAGTTASVSLASPGSNDNRPIAIFSIAVQEDQTVAGSGWSEMDDLTGAAPTRGLQTQYKSDSFDTSPSSTWTTSARWGAIGAELKASGGAPPSIPVVVLAPPIVIGG